MLFRTSAGQPLLLLCPDRDMCARHPEVRDAIVELPPV
jgi:hypothetical protein